MFGTICESLSLLPVTFYYSIFALLVLAFEPHIAREPIMATFEVIARGNAILVVGEGANSRRLKVDTTFLMAASEVMRAMLDGTFSDGQGLNYENPKEVHIPEDDPVAMTTICQILHHKLPITKLEWTPEEILGIAVIADKYLMQCALFFQATIWLSDAAQELKTSASLANLLIVLQAALLFAHEPGIKKITKVLVSQYAGEFSSLIEDNMPDDVVKMIRKLFPFCAWKGDGGWRLLSSSGISLHRQFIFCSDTGH